MKATYLMMGLLMFSIFATAFVLADDEAVEVSELAETDIATEDLEASLTEVDNFAEQNQFKKVGFSKVSKGHGFITSGDEGYLFSGFWASQSFANIDEETQEIKNSKARAFGGLQIINAGDFKLFKDLEKSNDDSLVFYVLERKEKVSNADEVISNAKGTLTLNKEKEYSDFTKWTGSLELNSGDLEGTWDVEIGTRTKVVKPIPGMGQGQKVGFWNKVKFWNWGNQESNSPDETNQYNDKDTDIDEKNRKEFKGQGQAIKQKLR